MGDEAIHGGWTRVSKTAYMFLGYSEQKKTTEEMEGRDRQRTRRAGGNIHSGMHPPDTNEKEGFTRGAAVSRGEGRLTK